MNNNSILTASLFKSVPSELRELFDVAEYPYEIIMRLRNFLEKIKLPDEFKELREGIWVADGARIANTAVIYPPTVICRNAEIRHCAFIRGSVYVGRGAVVGNSTEVKNSVLLDGAQVPHYNYVGDSILGCLSHMGAAAVTSNLKAVGGNVKIHGEEEIDTGLRKLGAMIGDGAEIGCGTVLNPGAVIGRKSVIYPLLSVRGTVPSHSIMKDASTIIDKIE